MKKPKFKLTWKMSLDKKNAHCWCGKHQMATIRLWYDANLDDVWKSGWVVQFDNWETSGHEIETVKKRVEKRIRQHLNGFAFEEEK